MIYADTVLGCQRPGETVCTGDGATYGSRFVCPLPCAADGHDALGYTETYALLLRKRNGGSLSSSSFVAATSALRTDVVINPSFRLLTVTDAAIIGSIALIQKHNLNSTDAALLTTFLRYAQASPDACALVAADQRLLRAAQV